MAEFSIAFDIYEEHEQEFVRVFFVLPEYSFMDSNEQTKLYFGEHGIKSYKLPILEVFGDKPASEIQSGDVIRMIINAGDTLDKYEFVPGVVPDDEKQIEIKWT